MNAKLRQHQGRPRGTPRRRRGLHGGHAGDDRPGRLADDVLPDAGRRAVLLRHLLPAEPRPGMPSFRQLLAAVVDAWTDRGDEVREAARADRRGAGRATPVRCPSPLWTSSVLDGAVVSLLRRVRPGPRRIRPRAEVPAVDDPGVPAAPPRAHRLRRSAVPRWPRTAEAMARGGLYDQLGGGFARYSVDAGGSCRTSRRCCTTTRCCCGSTRTSGARDRLGARRCASLSGPPSSSLRTLRTPEGGFASSLDADTDGVEGLTYVWTPSQLRDVLGDELGRRAVRRHRRGHVRGGRLDVAPVRRPAGDRCASSSWRRGAKRPQPGRDDKVIASWNGLAITALAEAGVALDRPQWIAMGGRRAPSCCCGCTLSTAGCGAVRATASSGTSAGVLEDYACVADGFLALHQATGEAKWLAEATRLLDLALAHFAVAGRPGRVLRHRRRRRDAGPASGRPGRQREPGRGVGAGRRAADGVRAGRPRRGSGTARRPSRRCAGPACWPRGCRGSPGTGCRSPKRCRPVRCRWRWWARTRRCGWPRRGACTAAASCWPASRTRRASRCWRTGPWSDGSPAAYVCRGYVCDRPVTTAEALTAQL